MNISTVNPLPKHKPSSQARKKSQPTKQQVAFGSIIHDNACGSGTVSRAILSSPERPEDIEIHATDIDPPFLSALTYSAKTNSWPIAVTNQKSEALTFKDNTFTHSITNIAIFFTSAAGVDGAKEIYRTLKPGGVAVVNCWAHVTWLMPVKTVHELVRPGKPFPTPVVAWHDGQHIQQVMKEAGFEEDKIKIEKSDAWAVVRRGGLREWAEKSWAYLGGIAGWFEGDGETWDEAVDKMLELLLVQPGTTVEGDMVRMKASQWVVVAEK